MKKLIVALMVFGFSFSTWGQSLSEDRVVLGEDAGMIFYGIKHAKNFDYACKVQVVDGSKTLSGTLWVDENFNLKANETPKTQNYRVALSWPENAQFAGTVGVEMVVKDVVKGQCNQKCLSIKVLTVEDEKVVTRTVDFFEVGYNKFKVDVTNDSGGTEIEGFCRANRQN